MILSGRLMLQPYLRPKVIRGPGGHAYAADLRLYFVGGRLRGWPRPPCRGRRKPLWNDASRRLAPAGRAGSLPRVGDVRRLDRDGASWRTMATTLEAMVAALDDYLAA